ncbi:hypothetical protein [Intrasporangium chromatireducens]|uniref:hypothetical protein n=1 Tax=Intrasporangium chromatireducens TaxID=1386088 RepID=UPI0012DEC0B5|nr:hypothetical protein [Intrasporangium chromatireducens]
MSADRVSIALKALGVIRGGEPLTRDELEGLKGLTAEERARAESLWAEGILAGEPEERLRVARLAWLLRTRPSMSAYEALASLSEEEWAEYLAINGKDL